MNGAASAQRQAKPPLKDQSDYRSLEFEQPIFRNRVPVESYGDGGFRLGGLRFEGSILLLQQRMEPWAVDGLNGLTADSLVPVLSEAASFDLLLLGCGQTIGAVPKDVRAALTAAGLGLEVMDTGTACRTYNVLIAEERRVAAALIAVD